MSRGMTVAQIALINARVRRPAYFIDVTLSSGHVRAWTGVGNVTVLGQTFSGVGEFGFIRGIETGRSLKSNQVSFGLHGLPGSLITSGVLSATRSVRYQGSPVTVYLGFTDTATDAPLADPTAIWAGVIDNMQFQIGESISVIMTAEYYTSHLRRANGLTMTTESHNQRLGNPSPRDLFFEAQSRLMGLPQPGLSKYA